MTILVDSREQTPYTFEVASRVQGMETGDYSIEGREDQVRVERKSFGDLFGCLTARLPAFKDQLRRLVKYPYHTLLLDTSVEAVLMGSIHCKLPGAEALSRLMGVCLDVGIAPVFCGRHGAKCCQVWLAHVERKLRDARS